MLVSFMPALGAKMIIDPTTYFSDVFVKGFYEIDLVNYFKKSLRPGMTCIDIGANIGYFTMLMAKRVGPRGSVISFEPTQNSLDLLRRNIQLNGFDNVVAENLALSDYNGAARFHEGPPGYEVYNSIGRITHPSAKDQSFTARSVSCVTLDDYLAARNIEKVDVIKIDVEGAELSVLRGMEKTLQTNPNARLIVEFAEQTTRGFGYSAKEIGDWLTKRGWRLALFNSRGRISEVTGDETWMGQMVLAYKAN
jgi:FkbM family methyltransferase